MESQPDKTDLLPNASGMEPASASLAPYFSKMPGGLVPAVIQDAATGVVLMLGYMNGEALDQTLNSGLVTFFSRSKQRLWTKGESSGHVLRLRSIRLDCDGDALLVRVRQIGAACHTGDRTCFDAGDLPAVVGGGAA